MKEDIIVRITAIICLTAIIITAIQKGIDSALLASISAIIGGIAGYGIKKSRKHTKETEK